MLLHELVLYLFLSMSSILLYGKPPLPPFPDEWTFRLHPGSASCEQRCKEHSSVSLLWTCDFFFLGYISQSGIAEICV